MVIGIIYYIYVGLYRPHEISHIKSDEVTDAIKQLNSNKSDGNYGLYSNHLLLSNFHFRDHLAKLFTCMLHHGHNPDYILEAVVS